MRLLISPAEWRYHVTADQLALSALAFRSLTRGKGRLAALIAARVGLPAAWQASSPAERAARC